MAPLYERAAKEAARLLDKYFIFEPPVDPEWIAEQEGLNVVYANFVAPANQDVSGFFDLAQKKIVINREISRNRITFTIAHELAHFIMHKEYIRSQNYVPMPRNNNYNVEKPSEEKEADFFAASLLVPLSILRRYKNFASVRELSTLFFVSEDVIRYRLNLLERYPSLAR